MNGIVIGCMVGAAAIGAGVFVHLMVGRKEDALVAEAQTEGATLVDQCMICDGYVEAPGVVMIVRDTLVTRSVLGTERRFPLSQVRVKKESRSFGRYPWWGKRIFHLDVPGIPRFAIGVKQPERWRTIFARAA
jgi:hypothetical protein